MLEKLSLGSLLAGLVLLGSLGSVVLWVLGPWSTYADAFSNIFGHALGGIVASAVALLWRRRALLVLTAGCLATLALHTVCAWQATSEVVMVRQPGRLKLVSLNTWHATNDLDRLQAFFEREDADLLLVYEFGPSKLALIERLQRTYPYAAGCAERMSVCDCSAIWIDSGRIRFEFRVPAQHDGCKSFVDFKYVDIR